MSTVRRKLLMGLPVIAQVTLPSQLYMGNTPPIAACLSSAVVITRDTWEGPFINMCLVGSMVSWPTHQNLVLAKIRNQHHKSMVLYIIARHVLLAHTHTICTHLLAVIHSQHTWTMDIVGVSPEGIWTPTTTTHITPNGDLHDQWLLSPTHPHCY